MEELFNKFKAQWESQEKNLVEIANTWYDLSQFEGAKERVKRELGITDYTLASLDKIHAGMLYPSIAWQSRGLMRIENMSYEDQRKLLVEGIEVLINGMVRKLKLNELSNKQICQAVTGQGRIKPVEEQHERVEMPKAPKPPYEFSTRGVRFTRNVTLTPAKMLSVVQEYNKWRTGRGKRRQA